jgi:hypothetical protein
MWGIGALTYRERNLTPSSKLEVHVSPDAPKEE